MACSGSALLLALPRKNIFILLNQYDLCEISGSQGGENGVYSFLGCSAVVSRWSVPTFKRCVLPQGAMNNRPDDAGSTHL
jgi:hypothetical protein